MKSVSSKPFFMKMKDGETHDLVGVPSDKCGVIAIMQRRELSQMIDAKLGDIYMPIFKHSVQSNVIFNQSSVVPRACRPILPNKPCLMIRFLTSCSMLEVGGETVTTKI